ncbi:DUF5134 domain-containing protein [Streptomyces sp. PTM05]|uniref:DUF5134 domain-containing protein n=1 Tax=Streptantibioticus parmotrematis TaxID=2873249 RepID=A0ABS7QSE2_9ACTN|nr:DUF5134 domain-containing protein [Streptantibioticus parmotrematis]MBY8886117.1 DUF5134 domain-containing protein [Streptantibioticus parmotrematis]
MIAATGLRWILTLVFALVTAFSVSRAVRPGAGHGGSANSQRVTHTLHALMGLAMIAMVWPWGTRLPVAPQVALFSLAAVWFVASVALNDRRMWAHDGGGHPRLHGFLHAVMMGAMAWMVAVMPDAMKGGHPSAGGGTGSMADMPGMAMSGSGGGMTMSLRGAEHTVCVALLAVFVAMTLWWLSRAFDTARATAPGTRSPAADPGALATALDSGCHGAMALGMAVMLLAMT